MTGEAPPASESTAVVLARAPNADLEAERRGERFLKRVAGLNAEGWGRLDAAAQRLIARDPLSRWDSARYHASFVAALPAVESAFVTMDLLSSVVDDAKAWLRGGPDWRRAPRPSSKPLPDTPLTRQLRALGAIRERGHQAGGAAFLVLDLALVALHARRTLPPDAFQRLYRPVEPVIPFASL